MDETALCLRREKEWKISPQQKETRNCSFTSRKKIRRILFLCISSSSPTSPQQQRAKESKISIKRNNDSFQLSSLLLSFRYSTTRPCRYADGSLATSNRVRDTHSLDKSENHRVQPHISGQHQMLRISSLKSLILDTLHDIQLTFRSDGALIYHRREEAFAYVKRLASKSATHLKTSCMHARKVCKSLRLKLKLQHTHTHTHIQLSVQRSIAIAAADRREGEKERRNKPTGPNE